MSSSQSTTETWRSIGSPSGDEEARRARADRDDLAVLDELDAARLGEERRNSGGQERLVVADADDQRALLARADEQIRRVEAHRDEREVALEVVVGEAHGLDQVAVVVDGDEVGDDLGVGLRGEDGAAGLEALAQREVVLDDAVDDDVDAVGVSKCGWAFCSLTRPCVAQRV